LKIKDKIFLLASKEMEITSPRPYELFINDTFARHCIHQLSNTWKAGANQADAYVDCVQKLKKVMRVINRNYKKDFKLPAKDEEEGGEE
jgi:hypothetical protein